MILYSCASEKTQNNHDELYAVINKEIQTKKNLIDEPIFLVPTGSNNSLLSAFKEQLENDTFNKEIETSQRMVQMATKDSSIVIKKDPVIDLIFTKGEYERLKSQNPTIDWNFDKISVNDVIPYKKDGPTTNDAVLKLSKPFITADGKYALVSSTFKTMNGIQVFVKDDNGWSPYRLIGSKIISLKN